MNTERCSMALVSVFGQSWQHHNKCVTNTTQVADKISSVFPMLNLNKPAFVVFPWNADNNNNRQYELSMGDIDTL